MYDVTFKLDDVVYINRVSALQHVVAGFWINEDGDWTLQSDALYFILPHMIRKIQKVPRDEQEED
jgi:hypothetical protein